MLLCCHACHVFEALPHDADQGARVLTVDTPCDRCGAKIQAKREPNHAVTWIPIVMARAPCSARGHTFGLHRRKHPDGRCSVCLTALP
jgi:hypothetical protein